MWVFCVFLDFGFIYSASFCHRANGFNYLFLFSVFLKIGTFSPPWLPTPLPRASSSWWHACHWSTFTHKLTNPSLWPQPCSPNPHTKPNLPWPQATPGPGARNKRPPSVAQTTPGWFIQASPALCPCPAFHAGTPIKIWAWLPLTWLQAPDSNLVCPPEVLHGVCVPLAG